MLSLVVFMPLMGALVVGAFYKSINRSVAQFITIACMGVATLTSIILFMKYNGANIYQPLGTWIIYDKLQIKWGVFADRLTLIMLIVVNSVSLLVHVYSVGYMAEDETPPRFMSYLSLFTFFMLILVTSNNLLQLFVGWEGVGLCSYLLIGYWYQKNSANQAAMKAFLVNRVGDVAFVIGMISVYLLFNSLQFDEIFAQLDKIEIGKCNILGIEVTCIDAICLLLFIGSMGKSAQLGLHVWLPDAMEGPTPVSALIHAATMVTAGVFLLARCSPLFEMSKMVGDIILVIGGLTAIFAAFVALGQNDIKKIIAYSTCSQLGYMFFACGAGAYQTAIFHLTTHAFFKALLFLGAGCVIHFMHHEQDIRYMGGLRTKMPITHISMIIGSLALMGVYPFAGYFSKDAILEAAFLSSKGNSNFAFCAGLLAAFCTSLYSWRLLIKVFYGKAHTDHHHDNHAHESPASMLIPIIILGICTLIVGGGLHHYNILGAEFWHGSIIVDPHFEEHHVPFYIKFLPLIITLCASILAYFLYCSPTDNLTKYFESHFRFFYKLSINKFYFDEIYNCIILKPFQYVSKKLALKDQTLFINDEKITRDFYNSSHLLSKLQSGYIYHYALVTIIGVISFITLFIFCNLYKGI